MAVALPKKIGKYDVIDVIGKGGMGIVYRAKDPFLDRLVAIKIMTINSAEYPDLLDRFFREAKATASFQHPNIVTVYELGEHEGSPYLAMQYLEGPSLEALIRSRQDIPLVQKLDIVIQVCHGLAYAHQLKVFHRDIKPGNIMVLKDGNVKIVDFGIARVGDTNFTRTGQFMGSLNYMSLEQLNGKLQIDGRTDVYSTGVVLYKLLTGVLPFEAESTGATLMKIINEAAPPFSKHLSSFPPELEPITLKALAKDRDERYSSADEFAVELTQLLDQLRQEAIGDYIHQAELLLEKGDLLPAHEQLLEVLKIDKQNTRAANLLRSIRTKVEDERPKTLAPDENGASHTPDTAQLTQIGPAVPARVLASDAEASKASAEASAGEFTSLFRAGSTGSFTTVFGAASAGQGSPRGAPSVKLTFTVSSDPLLVGRTVPLSPMPFRLGRVNSDLSISSDLSLSREHAVIDWDHASFTIADLNSVNGTYVNGKRLYPGTAESLPFGALIRLGNSTVLTFTSDEISELPDLTGDLIGGRYRLTRAIRNGFKSALYEATDLRLPQRVAVKVLSPSLASYPGYLEQFDREAQTAVQLSHPHIVKVIDYGEASISLSRGLAATSKYLTMELMEGSSLYDQISADKLPTLGQVVVWLDDVTDALEYAHGEGVIHSGLKLSSLVFDLRGKAYVTDFGMAYGRAGHEKRVLLGSPEFLAPEQWEGSEPSPRVDQYSLAALAYLLVTGSRPFEGQLDPSVREQNFVRGPIPAHEEALRKSGRTLNIDVSRVLNRALAVKPDERYASMREFFFAFRSAVAGATIQGIGKPRVFISYRRNQSGGWAELLARELRQKHEISVYIDSQRVDSAVRFPARLDREILNCDVFICLLSTETLQSNWVQEEIRLASKHGKSMVPVFQEGFSPPDFSKPLQRHVKRLLSYDAIRLLDSQNIYVDTAIAHLAEVVKNSTKKSREQ
ncbi:MAG TPA: protein kinase [Candidatus Acidoferrum sp.]|jgi:serine/threonine protein kinase|nr:protein kinase [Candidatus Acidoferrum sp.]